jgi:serine/threonine protein kinase
MDDDDFVRAIGIGDYDEDPLEDVDASLKFRDLLQALLQPNPTRRLTADVAAQHPFFQAARDAAAALKASIEAMVPAPGEAPPGV